MKIAIVLSSTPGYSETFFTSKIKGLQENGFEVILLVQEYSDNFNLCKVYKAPKVYANSKVWQLLLTIWVLLTMIPFFNTVFRYIKLERKEKTTWLQLIKNIYLNSHILKRKVDWLHFGFATQALGSELVAKAIGAKMAVSFRGFDINVYPLKHPNCYKTVWTHVDKVHSISNYLLMKATELGLSKEVPYKIITPAVDINKISEVKSQIPKTDVEIINFVTIARLNWIKGIDVSINAMKILKEKGFRFTYQIVGASKNKDIERYQFQVYQLGLTNEVSFIGKLSHKETIHQLESASIYLQPSYNEGFCNAVLEAQALGKLCVVSDTGGLPENIENNVTGWLVPKNNPKALANKIEFVINLTKIEKQEISENAQHRVKEYFSIEKQQQEFVEFYNL